MKIIRVTASAGRTFNHPHEQFSNLRCAIALTADIPEGEDAIAAAKELQGKCEAIAEDHKQGLLKSIRELAELTQMQREMVNLEEQLRDNQERLEKIRKAHPELLRLPAPDVEDPNSPI